MNASLVAELVRQGDELRETRARVKDLESLVAGLDTQVTYLWRAIGLLKEGVYDVAEGKSPRLMEVVR